MPEIPKNSLETATAWQRIVAYFIDYLVVAVYFGAMSAVHFLLRGVGVASSPSYVTITEKLQGQAVAILLFTFPVICYFALLESSAWQATVGKRFMHLRVVDMDGQRIKRATSFLRSVVKFTPWEVAHTGIWHVTGQPFVSPPGALSWWSWVVSMFLLLCWLVSLFVGSRRTPYD
jgi:uncharacterized RDD family membrane protein YckC